MLPSNGTNHKKRKKHVKSLTRFSIVVWTKFAKKRK